MSEDSKRSHRDGESKAPRRGSGRKSSGPLPGGQTTGGVAGVASEAEAWKDSLKSIQESIHEATGAVNLLRAALQEFAPAWRSLSQLGEVLRDAGPGETTAAANGEGAAGGTPEAGALAAEAPPFEPAAAREAAPTAEPAAVAPGAAHAARPTGGQAGAYSYTLTVEDTRRRVNLVPLHRALRSVPGVRDMSLLGYTNGVATIALDSRSGLEAPALESAIGGTTSRECKIWARGPDSFLVRVGT